MRIFDREQNEQRLLRKADKNISNNIEARIIAVLASGTAVIVIPDESTGTLYQVTIIAGEFVKRQL